MKKLDWYVYALDFVCRKKIHNIYKISYCNRTELSGLDANKELQKKIISGEPFFAGRIGFFEMAAMRAYEFSKEKNYDIVMKNLYQCAGFFPLEKEYGHQFLQVMKESINTCDYLGYTGEPMENYFINKYADKNMKVSEHFDFLQPWMFPNNPWSAALKEKKVLIVHPFENTIKQQYEKRDKLFIGTSILPKFELKIFKALQTTGDLKDDRFDNWFEALDYMTEEIMKIDFDVAILGCGAYGFPIGARIKQAGKQAIHMGGTSQLLFGIMGKRWDGTGPNSTTREIAFEIRPYYNEYWAYPLEEDTPISAKEVEYGPYWK